MTYQKNVLGTTLTLCCSNGDFTRQGFCYLPQGDEGNDLISPTPVYQFSGLKSGDRWCLYAMRWREALTVDVAPKSDLAATNETALAVIPLQTRGLYSHKNP